MAELYHTEEQPQLICWDRKNYSTFEDQLAALKKSRTVYVGNLSFFSTEQQIMETFSTVGPVKRLIMGINSFNKTPCGFCFVEYYNQEHYYTALKYLTDTACDDRIIRCDADGGFLPGRQFGRGRSGGQIRDERRTDYDPARGRFIPPEVIFSAESRKRGRDRDDDEDMRGSDRTVKYSRDTAGERDGGSNRRRSYPQEDRRGERAPRSAGNRSYFQHDDRGDYPRGRGGDRRDREVIITQNLGSGLGTTR